jgi:hypothetical protein
MKQNRSRKLQFTKEIPGLLPSLGSFIPGLFHVSAVYDNGVIKIASDGDFYSSLGHG